MTAFANNLYGDPTVLTRITGRAHGLSFMGDSIMSAQLKYIRRLLPGVVGYDTTMDEGPTQATGPQPYISPGALLQMIGSYNSRAGAGAATVSGTCAIGATSVVIASPTGGLCMRGFKVTLGTGGNAETMTVSTGTSDAANGYDGNSGYITTLTFTAATTKTHTGDPVTWQRPSGVDGYTLDINSESVFTGGAYAGGIAGGTYTDRFLDWLLVGDVTRNGNTVESTLMHDGDVLNNGAVDFYHAYLALPVNNGAPNMILNAYPPESSGYLTTGHTTQTFSLYAATPTVKVVKITSPAPVSRDANRAHNLIIQMGAGTIPAGAIYAPIKTWAVKSGATSGYVLGTFGTGSGYAFQDWAGTQFAATQWNPTYTAQLSAALTTAGAPFNLDTLLVALGTNNTPTQSATLAYLQGLKAKLITTNPAARMIARSSYNNTSLITSGNGAGYQAGVVQFATADPSNLVIDDYTDSGVFAMLNTYYLTGSLHTTEPTGTTWNAMKLLGDLAACAAVANAPVASFTSLTGFIQNAMAGTADAFLDRTDGVEAGCTPRQFFRLLAAVLLGKSSNDGTAFRDLNDTKLRVTAVVDSLGNRTVVTKDAT